MDFKPDTEEKTHVNLRTPGLSEESIEPAWLPVKEVLSNSEAPNTVSVNSAVDSDTTESSSTQPKSISSSSGEESSSIVKSYIQEPSKGPIAILATMLSFSILTVGQIYMIVAIAVGSAELASSLWKVPLQEVMFNCGPQDSFMGVFVLAATPIFWWAWYLRRRRLLKYLCYAVLGGTLAYLLSASLASISVFAQFTLALVTFVLLSIYHLSGSFLSRFQQYWPRSFSVSKWLLISYIPAMILFSLEFQGLDFSADSVGTKVSLWGMFETLGLLIAFCWLPAFLTGLNSRTKRIASALGLSVIGQLPVLLSSFIYCASSVAMLLALATIGGERLSQFFSQIAPPGMEPDFIFTANSMYLLIVKLISSFSLFVAAFSGISAGSCLAVYFNRRRSPSNEV